MRLLFATLVAAGITGPGTASAAPFQTTDAAPIQATASTDTVPGDLAVLFGGIGHGLTAPMRWSAGEWLAIPAGVAVLAAVSPLDDDVRRFALRNRGAPGDAFFGAVEPFGQGYSWIVIGGLYAGGWVTDRTELRRTAMRTLAASAVAAGVVTPAFKELVGRVRPRYTSDPYRFRPLSGNHAWPSGHTTQAFAVASVIAAESPHLAVDVLAWTLAAGVGGARMYHNAHWLTDVLAGAAIGTVVGRAMAAYRHGAGPRSDEAAPGGVRGTDPAPHSLQPRLEILSDGAPAVGLRFTF